MTPETPATPITEAGVKGFISRPVDARFWAKVDLSENDCWVWLGARRDSGYGLFCLDSTRTISAHRQSWEMAHGPIPDGMQVLHHCDNRQCVRPDHLFLGTNRDNVHDAFAKGRRTTRRGSDGRFR